MFNHCVCIETYRYSYLAACGLWFVNCCESECLAIHIHVISIIDVDLPHVGLVSTWNLMHAPSSSSIERNIVEADDSIAWFRGQLQCLVLLVLDWIILGVMLMYKK